MARRHKVKVRLKVRARGYRRFFTLLGGLAIAGAAAYALLLLPPLLRAPLAKLSYKVSSFSVEAPDSALSADISRYMERRVGGPFRRGDLEALETAVRARHPYLKRIKAERNYFSGGLELEAEAEEIVGRAVLNGSREAFLCADGRLIFSAPEALVPAGVAVSIESSGTSGFRGLAAFLKKLNSAPPGAGARPESVRFSEEDGCEVTLAGGVPVRWGGLDYTASKLRRLDRVVRDASTRLRGSFRVDLRYFQEGKILVSKFQP